MAAERYSSEDCPLRDPISSTETSTEPATEQKKYQGFNASSNRSNIQKSIIASGVTLGAVGVIGETTRRLGVDRHTEAGFAERAHAETYAKTVGGKVLNHGTSAFTPDGGIDSIIETTSEQLPLQSKHFGQAVGDSVLKQYDGYIRVFGATNGVTESANPEAYGMDIITADDWSWQLKAKLEGRRVVHGCRRGTVALKQTASTLTRHLVHGSEFARRQAANTGRRIYRSLAKGISEIATKFARRSTVTQLVLIVAIVGLLYLLWRWYQDEDEPKDEDVI